MFSKRAKPESGKFSSYAWWFGDSGESVLLARLTCLSSLSVARTGSLHSDLALLPFILLACRRVAIHFHAGGIAEFLPKLPRLLRVSLKALYARADAGS
jgi:hypothetical protein